MAIAADGSVLSDMTKRKRRRQVILSGAALLAYRERFPASWTPMASSWTEKIYSEYSTSSEAITRRFSARPSAASLLATGFDSP